MERISFTTKSHAQTRNLGRFLGKEISSFSGNKGAFVVALSGDLGSGKTLFTQGIAKGLSIREAIHSPTFIIMRKHAIEGGLFHTLWHIDCYRVALFKELTSVGFKKIISDRENVVVIEWAERVKTHLPHDTLWISFFHTDNIRMREIHFHA